MNSQSNEQRQELINTVLEMNRIGINQGTSGNASIRVQDGFLITPSGIAYEDITPEDIVLKHPDGSHESPNRLRKPSSEWRFHQDIFTARPEINAIVHTHGKAAMTIACLRKDVPSFHYMIGITGGDTIRCAPYATFATKELSDLAVTALQDRKACLLANHGLIALGGTLKQALSMAMEVETLCDVYWRTLVAGGAVILGKNEMDEALEKFNKGYGSGKAFANSSPD
ncbi:class II aldolase/adducin family protein [Kiloniella laminariae]|uniref:Class II aldolase/adducin family protein n=1 Tax=Kiloniella laminariae TaxID=454162 RepID=A0ABT4LM74_9PROT|nr:class II aldolase/adducin family protein [Kiloniella laminariae]MCZ4281476.1 class II aldolase/adducin family protein [Kiloniella laminariae]